MPNHALRIADDDEDRQQIYSDWRAAMRAEGLSARTALDWPRIVDRAARDLDCDPLRFDYVALTYWLGQFAVPNTRATYYRALLGWHRWLARTGRRVGACPMDLMRPPKVPRGVPHPCSTISLHRLLDSDLRPRTRAMVLLGAYQGLRVHEIAKVHGRDVDSDTLRVLGKGGVDARLPLHPEVAATAPIFSAAGYWFESRARRGQPIGPHAVTVAISEAMAAAGVRGTAHSLRHWYATNLLREGADIRVVQSLMRHRSLATTEIYLEVADDSRRAAVLRLPSAGGPRS